MRNICEEKNVIFTLYTMENKGEQLQKLPNGAAADGGTNPTETISINIFLSDGHSG